MVRNKRIVEINVKSGKEKNSVIFIRWILLAAFLLIYHSNTENRVSLLVFYATYSTAVLYNLLESIYIYKKQEEENFFTKVHVLMDIIVVCILSYQTGGIDSDGFIVLLFIILYYGVRYKPLTNINICVISILGYSICSIYSGHSALEGFNFGRLFFRNIMIMLSSYGISVVINEVKKYDEVRKNEFRLARTDKLTGLANRYYFEQKLHDEIEYSEASGKPLNLLIFDLDNFKRFNENYGNIWGDKLLVLFADIIKQNTRKYDTPIRYGGEVFLILIRDLDLKTAKNVGERIRRQLEKQGLSVENEEDKKRITVSCGIAQYPAHSRDFNQVIKFANQALKHAKKSGKNMVLNFDELELKPAETGLD
ncbi:MAG: GGDEF domain-containing protein [Clostridia bacterium]|nr:GGDEF domain-containing protein [Clostridia bacterium]